MNDTPKLRFPLASQFKDAVSDDAVMRVKGRVFAAMNRTPADAAWSVWRRGSVLMGVLVLAVLTFVGGQQLGMRRMARSETTGPLLTRAGTVFEGLSATKKVRADFADGSVIELEPMGKVSVLASTAQEFSVLLEHGELHVQVVPGGPRRWVVEARLARVEVVGTDFRVKRFADRVQVSVARGVVLVRSTLLDQGVQRLNAGQHLEVIAAAPRAGTGGNGDHPVTPSSPLSPPAYAPLPSIDELFAAADRARLTGSRARAEAALQQIVRRFPADSRAPVAHYTLGLVRLSAPPDRRGAIAEFERVLESGASKSLREDALARLVEVHREAGETPQAEEFFLRYRKEFPSGRHLERLQAKLQTPGAVP